MDKILYLLENDKENFLKTIDELYRAHKSGLTTEPKSKNRQRVNKTICHFEALGNKYNSDVFVDNFIKFLTDVYSTIGYAKLKMVMGSYVNNDYKKFSKNCISSKQYTLIAPDCYVNHYSATSIKIDQIQRVAEKANVTIKF